MAIFIINVVLICAGVNFVAAHNLTDAEVLAYDAPNEIKESFSYYLTGYDEEGAPIWIVELGKWDIRKYAEQGGDLFEDLHIYTHRMFLIHKESGLNSTAKQYIAIIDMDGFNIRQAGHAKTVQFIIDQFVRVEKIIRDGVLKQAYIVNSNLLFESIFSVGSSLLGSLKNSVDIYGTNKDVWIPKLLKQLPKDQLPEQYGGLPNQTPVTTME